MRIGIDARLIEETGVGRYIRNLVDQLAILDSKNEYVIFLRKKSFEAFVVPNSKWRKVLADVAWHTLREQFVMPKILGDAKLDLVHIPYHNPPIFYRGRMVITIHDLTILHFATGKATTLPPALYALKRLGYWVELAVGLRLAKVVIAVSETTKKEIADHFALPSSKIFVTYEGANLKKSKDIRMIPEEYFLYVGNAYPHKNLDVLIKTGMHVVYVGQNDYFYQRFGIKPMSVSDTDLANLYQNAKALVFPSLMEGFGLPAVEALSLGCPIICSDISIFHEIVGEKAIYFNPKDPEDLAKKMKNDIPRTIAYVDKKYSWEHMARETKKLYESSTHL